MRHDLFQHLSLLAALLLAGCAQLQQSAAPTPGHEPHTQAHWSYEGATGPAHWGELAPEYALCASGRSQSPIDIDDTTRVDLPNLTFHYAPTPVEILNNGHTVQVNYEAGSHLEVDGVRYELAQFHFHAPSEHTIAGKQAAAEMHLVHKSATGALAVVGVLLEQGEHNPRFAPIWDNLPGKPGAAQRFAATIDADDLLPSDPRTYRYMGSLTTPPGTEGVRWHLMVEPVQLSAAQLAAFTRVYRGNNRPLQARNGRQVLQDSSR
jgi:carbonic anhydrase